MSKQRLRKRERRLFSHLVEAVASAASEGDVPFFLVSGSLLGVQRFGDILPWDDDVDMGVSERDVEKLNATLMRRVRVLNFKCKMILKALLIFRVILGH